MCTRLSNVKIQPQYADTKFYDIFLAVFVGIQSELGEQRL